MEIVEKFIARRLEMEQSLVQILVVVANIQVRVQECI